MTVIPDLGVDGANGVGRNLVRAGGRDRYHLARIGMEEQTALAEGDAALDGRRLHVAVPGGARLVRATTRAVRSVSRPVLPVPIPSSVQAPGASEDTRSAQIGGWLFRHRGLLPIPLGVLAACVPGNMTARVWIFGLIVITFGEVVRLAGVAVAGPETRRRSRAVAHLVTEGPYAWVRNPLYVGNALTWIGVAIISGVPWLLPLATTTFAIEYGLIVRYEEAVLESLFGETYLSYKGRTARWIPRPPAPGPRRLGRGYDWVRAWRSESSTFVSLGGAIAVLIVKAMVMG